MSPQSGYAPNNYAHLFVRNGPSTQPASGLSAQSGTLDLDPYLTSSSTAPSVVSEYLDAFGIDTLQNVRGMATQLENHSPFLAGLGTSGLEARLSRFYTETDGPWNPQKSTARGVPQPLPPSFATFRDTNVPSECNTLGPCTDSGYGSQARHSVGIPSDCGDLDRASDVLLSNRLVDFHIPAEQRHAGAQLYDAAHSGNPWNQGLASRPNSAPVTETPRFFCKYCFAAFKNQSEHKKHTARHEKPHKCPVPGCRMATEGFALPNDVQRHLNSKHRKGGTRYRCRHGACREKNKEWPRADNFRTHLKKMHQICLTADDGLAEYVCRQALTHGSGAFSVSPTTGAQHGSPELLTNVALATGMIPPTDMAQVVSTQPVLWQTEKESLTNVYDPDGNGFEPHLNQQDVSKSFPTARRLPSTLAPPAISTSTGANGSQRPRTTPVMLEDHVSSRRGVQDIELGFKSRHDFRQKHLNGAAPGREMSYVQPTGLRSCKGTILSPPVSAPGDGEHGSPVFDDEDEDDNSDDDVHSHSGGPVDYTNEDGENRSSVVTPKSSDGRGDDDESTRKSRLWSPRPRFESQEIGLRDSMESASRSPSNKVTARSTEDKEQKPAREHFTNLTVKVDTILRKLADDGKLNEDQRREIYETIQEVGLAWLDRGGGKTEEISKGKSSSTHPCPVSRCTKIFRRPCELKKHIKRHEKPYGCTQCSNAFGSKNDWKRHENGQHLQHEMWKCDEPVVRQLPAVSGPCGKVCHRRETFRQHLSAHHGVADKAGVEVKLEKCRFGRAGEPRFWCGFCRDVIELDGAKHPADPFNARYDHIEDHYLGRNGTRKRKASEWQADSAADVMAMGKTPTPGNGDGKVGSSSPNTADFARTAESKKRSRSATSSSGAARETPSKRMKAASASPRGHMMSTCCQCLGQWSFATVPSCMSCVSTHERCNNCNVEQVEPTEEQQ